VANDTHDFHRAAAAVIFGAPYEENWMWIGNRKPVLRSVLG
jgi:hypothetical protein